MYPEFSDCFWRSPSVLEMYVPMLKMTVFKPCLKYNVFVKKFLFNRLQQFQQIVRRQKSLHEAQYEQIDLFLSTQK